MTFAVISDIHSNLEALNAVLEDIDRQNIKTIHFLGDIIGYGPNPREVIEIAKNFEIKVLGNHDQAFLEPIYLASFNPDARKADEWTKQVLSDSEQRELTRQFKKAPFHRQKDQYLFAHGDYLRNQKYLITQNQTKDSFRYMEQHDVKVLFVGHTHKQGYFSQNGHYFSNKLTELYFDDFKNQRLIVNPGGLGQPRDGDPRTSYVIVTDDKIQFRRLSYDIEATVAKIKAENGLPDSLAFRLFTGS